MSEGHTLHLITKAKYHTVTVFKGCDGGDLYYRTKAICEEEADEREQKYTNSSSGWQTFQTYLCMGYGKCPRGSMCHLAFAWCEKAGTYCNIFIK